MAQRLKGGAGGRQRTGHRSGCRAEASFSRAGRSRAGRQGRTSYQADCVLTTSRASAPVEAADTVPEHDGMSDHCPIYFTIELPE